MVSESGLINTFNSKDRDMLLILGEFIDNSIGSAKSAGKKSIDVKIVISGAKKRFYFLDNSIGIDKKNLDRIWRFYNLGSAYQQEGLNRGGIGFKHAGFWLGKKICIFSKQLNGNEHTTYKNYDEILKYEEEHNDDLTNNEVLPINFETYYGNDYHNLFNFFGKGWESGTLISIEDMTWPIRDYAKNQMPFQESPKKTTKSGAQGEMNIYKQLYWRYERMIENKDDFKLNLTIVLENELNQIEDPIEISAKTVGFLGITFDKQQWLSYVQNPLFEFEKIRSIASRELESSVLKHQKKYGTTIKEIVTKLESGDSFFEISFPLDSNAQKHFDNVKAMLYLLDYAKIDEKFSSVRIMHGIEYIQDGRSLNTAASTTSLSLQHDQLKLLSVGGEYVTLDNYWMVQVFLDSDNPNNKAAFEPDDSKNKIKSNENREMIISGLRTAIKELHINDIFELLIKNIRPKSKKDSSLREVLDSHLKIEPLKNLQYYESLPNSNNSTKFNNNNEYSINKKVADVVEKKLLQAKKGTSPAIKNFDSLIPNDAVLSSRISTKFEADWSHEIKIDENQLDFIKYGIDSTGFSSVKLIFKFNFNKRAFNLNKKDEDNYLNWIATAQFLATFLDKVFFEQLEKERNIDVAKEFLNVMVKKMNIAYEVLN